MVGFGFFQSHFPIYAEELDTSQLYSQYVYLMNADTGEVLFEKESDIAIYPASMTKLMTVALALEHLPNLDDTYTITNETYGNNIATNGASLSGFQVGDSPTYRDLLYGTLLPSGAESAQALALAVGGSFDGFVAMMNQKAQDLNMTNTHFTNPTGLHNDNQYSTCHDIALLLLHCQQYPIFHEILGTYTYDSIPVSSHPNGVHMEKHLIDRLWEEIPNFGGGKTGYTPQAGRCLASFANVEETNLILVTAQSRQDTGPQLDAITIYNWAKDNYDYKTLLSQGEYLGSIAVEDAKEEDTISIYAKETVQRYLPNETNPEVKINLVPSFSAPVEEGTSLGNLEITLNDTVIHQETYELDHKIVENNRVMLEHFIKDNPMIVAFYGLFIVLLILFIMQWIQVHSKRKSRKG